MVDINATILKLMNQNDATIDKVINSATDDYFRLLKSIAEDIYDSCIAVYYDSYEPRYYTRHGHPEGVNLYRANNMSYRNGNLDFDFDPSKLLKYANTGEDKKTKVLNTVLSGLRGTQTRTKLADDEDEDENFPWKTHNLKDEWPMSWKEHCTYPNEFSKYKEHWKSTKNTMFDIFKEFTANGLVETNRYFWEYVAKYI